MQQSVVLSRADSGLELILLKGTHLENGFLDRTAADQSIDKHRSGLSLAPDATHRLFVHGRIPVQVHHNEPTSPDSAGT